MTEKADRAAEIHQALEKIPGALGQPMTAGPTHANHVRGRAELAKARRIEALTMRIKGKSYREIAEHLGVGNDRAQEVVRELLRDAENTVAKEMRAIENERLDVAQAAIWPKVEKGNLEAVDTFIRLSNRRADLNGLNAPKQVSIHADVRVEMEQALHELEKLLTDPKIVDAEIVDDGDDE